MFVRRFSFAFAALIVGLLPLAAQVAPDATLTVAVTGTLGPVLSGSDPLQTSGHTGSLTLMALESMAPTKTSDNSAVYTVPPGAITDVIGLQSFTSTTPGKLIVTLTPTADILTVIYNSRQNTVTTLIAYLAPGSWSSAVMMHPMPFSPSPQNLLSATVAGGPGSQMSYTYQGTTTVLGLAGTISNSAPANPPLPEPDLNVR